ncbi:haloacid dehalogenase [Annulohypoxylon bovei var. microspora]|nr:haloacid dehalogenase [Annulohypoxylon bovei var. microspora]
MAAPIPEALRNIKALTFDVFGTVVDHRTSVPQELVSRAQEKIASPGFSSLPEVSRTRFEAMTDEDWAKVAEEWRTSYWQFTRSFVPGKSEWKDIDAHHYEALHELLRKWELTSIYTDDEVRSLSLVWHKLKPWDDSAAGIRRLGTRFVTSTLSNGNRSLLQDLDSNGSLGFRKIQSSADFGAYKPHPSTYLGAAAALGVRPDEVAMVAAHLADLAGARTAGLRTIYVERPREESWGAEEQQYKEAREWVDLWVTESEDGFLEVARRLGIPE